MVFGFGRIEFDGNFINLNRAWTDFQPRRSVKSNSVQAESGIEQTVKFFHQWFINARLNLLDPQEKSQLQRLFEYAEDGSSFTLIRDRNLGTYIPFEGGINPSAAPRGLKTNDDIDGTFTRTNVPDSAWYLDEGTGLVTLRDGANVPRFPAGKYGAGIQIDGVAVNLIDAPSGPFTSGNWGTINMTVNADTAETLDPAGTNTADKLTATATNGSIIYTSSTAVGNDVSMGVWLKSSTGNVSANLQIRGSGGGSDSVAITVTPIWQRFSLTADTTAYTTNLLFDVIIDTNTEIIYIWGVSAFDSAEFDKGTIGAASTSSITRNAEKLTYLSANSVNRDKGTVMLWVKPRWVKGSNPLSSIFDIEATSGNSFFRVRVLINGALEIRMHNGDNSIEFETNPDSVMTQDIFAHLAFTYDTTVSIANLVTIIDGVLIQSFNNTNGAFNPKEVGTNISIGAESDGTFPAFCIFDDILILNNVLTVNEIKGIFDLGIGLGVPRNRWTVQLNDQVWNPRWLSSDVYDIPLLLKEVLT